jgi:tetratricopeptide (TPR) repeat protein
VLEVDRLAAARRAVDADPASADAHVALGTALAQQGQTLDAARAFQQANLLRPDDPATLANLGLLLSQLEQHETAIACWRHAAALRRDDPTITLGLAVALYRAGDIPAAASLHRRAAALAPNNPVAWIALGDCLIATGEHDEAIRCLRQALVLDPGQLAAYRSLALLGPSATTAADIDRLAELLDRNDLAVADRITIGFALGQMLDAAKRFDEAFPRFVAANALVLESHAAIGRRFDSAAFESEIDRLITQSGPASIAGVARLGNPSETPVFIIGMPRSGSTLVEQIAASHSLVAGVGERNELSFGLNALTRQYGSRQPSAWDTSEARAFADLHLARLTVLAGGTDSSAVRVVDKTLDNVFHLDQIAALFPNARVIMCRRDLRDVCLSCYFHQFADENLYTYDLLDCARRALAIERLMAHWRAVLRLRMHEVVYESLIATPEAETWRLIDFLGVQREAACLAPHLTARVVTTTSAWQIRQPINQQGVGRWRLYRRHLSGLLEALGDSV